MSRFFLIANEYDSDAQTFRPVYINWDNVVSFVVNISPNPALTAANTLYVRTSDGKQYSVESHNSINYLNADGNAFVSAAAQVGQNYAGNIVSVADNAGYRPNPADY